MRGPERDGPIDPPPVDDFRADMPVIATVDGVEIVGVVAYYRTLSTGRLYTVKAEDGRLLGALPARRLRLA